MDILLNLLYIIGLIVSLLVEAVGLYTIFTWFIDKILDQSQELRELRRQLKELNKGDN